MNVWKCMFQDLSWYHFECLSLTSTLTKVDDDGDDKVNVQLGPVKARLNQRWLDLKLINSEDEFKPFNSAILKTNLSKERLDVKVQLKLIFLHKLSA